MRTIGAIQALEAALGRPVITSNQVAFWGALRLAKIPAPVAGYGQLFDKQLLQRTRDLRLAVSPAALQWQGGLIIRGVKTLPVTFARLRTSA